MCMGVSKAGMERRQTAGILSLQWFIWEVSAFSSLFPNEDKVVLHLPKGLSPSGAYGLLSGLPGAAWLP